MPQAKSWWAVCPTSIAPDANVQLGGSYGAFTMITPGMNVSIVVQRYIESGHRQIIEVKELAPGVVPEQY